MVERLRDDLSYHPDAAGDADVEGPGEILGVDLLLTLYGKELLLLCIHYIIVYIYMCIHHTIVYIYVYTLYHSVLYIYLQYPILCTDIVHI